jgi:hypothetical protein
LFVTCFAALLFFAPPDFGGIADDADADADAAETRASARARASGDAFDAASAPRGRPVRAARSARSRASPLGPRAVVDACRRLAPPHDDNERGVLECESSVFYALPHKIWPRPLLLLGASDETTPAAARSVSLRGASHAQAGRDAIPPN